MNGKEISLRVHFFEVCDEIMYIKFEKIKCSGGIRGNKWEVVQDNVVSFLHYI